MKGVTKWQKCEDFRNLFIINKMTDDTKEFKQKWINHVHVYQGTDYEPEFLN